MLHTNASFELIETTTIYRPLFSYQIFQSLSGRAHPIVRSNMQKHSLLIALISASWAEAQTNLAIPIGEPCNAWLSLSLVNCINNYTAIIPYPFSRPYSIDIAHGSDLSTPTHRVTDPLLKSLIQNSLSSIASAGLSFWGHNQVTR